MCFPTIWEFSSHNLGVFNQQFPHNLGVLTLFFCFNVGNMYLCDKSNTYEKETAYHKKQRCCCFMGIYMV